MISINFRKPIELKPNALNSRLFGQAKLNTVYITLKESIIKVGITQPVLINSNDEIFDGNLRHQIAIELGIEIPTINIDSLLAGRDIYSLLSSKPDLAHNYLTLIQNIKQQDTAGYKVMLVKTLKEVHDIVQGTRTDLDPAKKAAKSTISTVVGKGSEGRINKITKSLEAALPDKQDQLNWLTENGATTSVKSLEKKAKRLAASKLENAPDLNAKYDFIKGTINIHNQSCTDLSPLMLKSIQTFYFSCPYLGVPTANSGLTDPEIFGNEKTVEEFVERLVKILLNCVPYLTDDGSIFVNIADKMRNGTYQLVPETLMIKMVEAGFKIPMKFYWVKSNAQPGDGQNTSDNIEYVIRFSVCDQPYTNFDWLNETKAFDENKLGSGDNIKLSSFINLQKGFISTSAANTKKLRDACEKVGSFYLDHHTTQPPELPYAIIKLSCKENSHVCDIFNGCGTTAKAMLECPELNLTYHGFEIRPLYVRASEINIGLSGKTIPMTPDQELSSAA